jgi:hypothetical protein
MGDIKRLVEAKRALSPEETERRRTHVRIAIAENRLEGIKTSAETRAVFDAYIRGEVDASDLVKAYKDGGYNKGPQPG